MAGPRQTALRRGGAVARVPVCDTPIVWPSPMTGSCRTRMAKSRSGGATKTMNRGCARSTLRSFCGAFCCTCFPRGSCGSAHTGSWATGTARRTSSGPAVSLAKRRSPSLCQSPSNLYGFVRPAMPPPVPMSACPGDLLLLRVPRLHRAWSSLFAHRRILLPHESFHLEHCPLCRLSNRS